MPAANDALITPDRYRTTNGESIDYEEFRRFALHAKVNASPDARLNNFHIDELWSLACARKVQQREWEPFINSLEQEFDAAAAKCVQFPAPPPDVRKALLDAATHESPAPSLAAVISQLPTPPSDNEIVDESPSSTRHVFPDNSEAPSSPTPPTKPKLEAKSSGRKLASKSRPFWEIQEERRKKSLKGALSQEEVVVDAAAVGTPVEAAVVGKRVEQPPWFVQMLQCFCLPVAPPRLQ